jgi:threonylcarbamoyladenosine tRNA methylthiotransferase MtaB
MNLSDNNTAVFGYTLGCRLNSFETEALVEELVWALSGRKVTSPREADLILVNSCAVTGRSQGRSRRTVRSYASKYPDASIVVTGCAAAVSPEDFAGMERVTVVPNAEKHRIVSIIKGEVFTVNSDSFLFPSSAPLSTNRTRGFLKIQDGCSNRCTYCIVPTARGSSRSQPRGIVLKQARDMVKAGFREISLTGVDIADYGRGLYTNGYGLPQLVEELLEIGGFRLRIGSIEPMYLTVKTLEALAVPGLCRHFHIPFQSGSNSVLKRMGRRYGREEEDELLSAVASLFPGACVGSDIIAGFPGESEEDYARSFSLAEDSRINYLHVFPFSPRPGTPAAEMKPVHTEIITERSRKLREVSAASRRHFRKSNVSKTAEMLVESRKINGRTIGFTDNYIPVYAPDNSVEGEITEVVLTEDSICWEQR